MARIRKFSSYQNLERPYTRISKYTKKNFVRGGFPHMKISRFDMGDVGRKFDLTLRLNVTLSMNIRHNSLEAARMTSNRLLEKVVGKEYHFRLKVYPFHVLRENPLASGAGADRMSTGMSAAYGKAISCAARLFNGQTLFELRVNKPHLKTAREALERAAKKVPCGCKIVTIDNTVKVAN